MKKLALAVALIGVATASNAATAGLAGEFWDVPVSGVNSIADAEAVIASRSADETFVATTMTFPVGGGVISAGATLDSFLGANATGLSCVSCPIIEGSVFRFSGLVDTIPGSNTTEVFSDDGFQLIIDGQNAGEVDRNRIAGATVGGFMSTGGKKAIELIYWEGPGGGAVLDLKVNDVTVDASNAMIPISSVPVPAALPLLVSALGLAGWLGRRRVA